jgi:PAS domain S-box-containing protein
VLVTTLGAILATLALLASFERRHAERHASESLHQIAWNMRDALDRGMQQNFAQVQALARLAGVREGHTAEQESKDLDRIKAIYPQFAWLGMTDNAAHVIASTDGLLRGASVASRPWYSGAQDRPYVGDVHEAVLLAKLLPAKAEPWRFVDIAMPVVDAGGVRRGILAAHLSWDWARDVGAELLDPALRDRGAEVLVLSHDGTVLLGPPSLQGRPLDNLQRQCPVAASAGLDSAGIVGGTGGLRSTIVAGERLLYACATTRGAGDYPGLGWHVLVRQPESVAMADYRKLRAEILLGGLLLAGAFGVLSAVVARQLGSPLQLLTAVLKETESAGSIDVERVGHYREAYQLATALRDMAQRQQRHAAELETLNETLQSRVAERTEALADANDELRRAETLLRGVTDHLPAAIGYFDPLERCRFANPVGARTHGIDPAQIVNMALQEIVGEDAYRRHRPQVESVLAGRRSMFEGTAQRNGRTRHFQAHFIPALNRDGGREGFYVMSLDTTAAVEAQRRAAAAEQRLRTITDNLPALISYIDLGHRVRFLNATFQTWLGIDIASSVDRPLEEILGDVHREPIDRALAGERLNLTSSSVLRGVRRDLETSYVPHVNEQGDVLGAYVMTNDVTVLKDSERALQKLARFDTLTGLPNRLQLNDRLPEALSRGRRAGLGVAVLFIDVDHFKQINDTFGHAAGDAVLKEFAQRLKAAVRQTDLVAPGRRRVRHCSGRPQVRSRTRAGRGKAGGEHAAFVRGVRKADRRRLQYRRGVRCPVP